ncbi:MAG: serine hydroxymethyltransferase, partial [Theionarchaea archaeon]|nr:serine hydroxymethyltransferase [Theionarchaea archaeon]
PVQIVDDHESWRTGCINLIPSENIMSQQARSLLTSDMGHRYTLPGIKEMDGRLVENAYRGTRYLDEVESLAADLAREVYGCDYACVRPLSGHVSAMIALNAVCGRGDKILAVEFARGGYPGYDEEEMAGMLGLKVDFLPYDDLTGDLIYDDAAGLIEATKPRATIIGASKMLFPPDISRVRGSCDKSGSNLLYDASHVLGLLAGGRFGNPFDEGADLIYGSTHKTLFGPQGGIMLTNDGKIADSIEQGLHWKTLDNAHWNRIACLAQVLLEIRSFGSKYADQLVANSKALARALDDRNFPVQCKEKDYTESHQVGLDAKEVSSALGYETFEEVAKKLEEADIIIDCVGRLGTCEMTRLGMVEREMVKIAELITRLLMEGEGVASVKSSVNDFRSKFQQIHYAFE